MGSTHFRLFLMPATCVSRVCAGFLPAEMGALQMATSTVPILHLIVRDDTRLGGRITIRTA